MYNPLGSDNNKEYVEVYGFVNLTNWIIGDSSSNDTLILLNYFFSNYSLIVEEGFNYSGINASIYSAGATIGDNLNNNFDTIFLFDNDSNLVDSVSYDGNIANGDGYSLEMVNFFWNRSCKIYGSPGYDNLVSCNYSEDDDGGGDDNNNSYFHDVMISSNLDELSYMLVSYDKLFKVSNVDYALGYVYNVTVFYNVSKLEETGNFVLIKESDFLIDSINRYVTSGTGSFIFNESGNYTVCGKILNFSLSYNTFVIDDNLENDISCRDVYVFDSSVIPCNVSLTTILDKELYEEGESVKFKHVLSNESFPYVIEYYVLDLFGKIVKSSYETSNLNQKSWTPKFDGPEKAFILKSNLSSVLCNDENLDDNFYQNLFVFRDLDYVPFSTLDSEETLLSDKKSANSSIVIESLSLGSDNKIKFGEDVKGKVRIYKGDTSKYSVKFYIENSLGEKVSVTDSSANLYTKYSEYLLSVPVILKSNCNEKYSDSEYYFVVQGLDSYDKVPFLVEGLTNSLCSSSSSSSKSSSSSSKKGVVYEIEEIPSIVYTNENFLVKVRINNYDDVEHDFELIGYVYRGSKQYSESVIKEVSVSKNSAVTLLFDSLVTDVNPGDYKYKVKIKKDSQKTYKHLNSDIVIRQGENDFEIIDFYLEPDSTESFSETNTVKLYAESDFNDAELILDTFYTTIRTNISGKVSFPVRINDGRNVFFLSIQKEGVIYDMKELVIESDENGVVSYKENVNLLSNKNYDVQLLSGLEELTSNKEINDGVNNDIKDWKRGEVIYMSSSEHAEELIPFLILLVCFVSVFAIFKFRD